MTSRFKAPLVKKPSRIKPRMRLFLPCSHVFEGVPNIVSLTASFYSPLTSIKTSILSTPEGIYDLGDNIASCHNGHIRECQRIMTDGGHSTQLCVKIISKRCTRSLFEEVSNEIKYLQHPCVIRSKRIINIIDVAQDSNYVYIFMEKCDGGDLFHLLTGQVGIGICEITSRQLFIQMVEACFDLHDNNLAHGDISIENFCLLKGQVMLIDLGRCVDLSVDQKIRIKPSYKTVYLPPEVLNSPVPLVDAVFDVYAIDIYALGICLLILLLGRDPTSMDISYIQGRRVEVDLSHLSRDVIHLLYRCLEVNPDDRICINELMEHPWMGSISL